MIPGARFAHLTGASLAAALAQADSAERDTLRKLAELRAAFEGQEHPKFEAVTVAAPAPAAANAVPLNRAARRRGLRGAAGRNPGSRR